MPKLTARKSKIPHLDLSQILVQLEAGTKKLKLDPRFKGPNATFRLPQIYLKEVIQRSLTDLRVFAESSQQYMLDRVYAQRGRRVSTKPTLPHTAPNNAAKPFDLKPLSKRHARFKRKRKLDGRILIASGQIMHELVIQKVVRDGDVTYILTLPNRQHIGSRIVKKGAKRITIKQLMAVLEFGSGKRKIPPRPIWRPTAKEMTRRFARAPEKLSANALRSFLKKARR